MKILFDTSYFLPLIKISIEKIPPNLLLELLKDSKHSYYFSELSLFELTAKGIKFATKDEKITIQDVITGIDAIQNDSRLKILTWANNPLIIELAGSLKVIHQDTIDCLIFATAICKCDCLATMDREFYNKISKNPSIKKEIFSLNEGFQFWFDDFSDKPELIEL